MLAVVSVADAQVVSIVLVAWVVEVSVAMVLVAGPPGDGFEVGFAAAAGSEMEVAG